MKKLRPYQRAAIEKLAHREVTVLPTGSGKTLTAAVHAVETNQSTLVLVHREELVPQWEAAFRDAGYEGPVGHVQGSKNDWQEITVGLIQTLRNRLPLPQYDFVIADEAHRFTTEGTGVRILDSLEEGGAFVSGWTATPSINMKPIYGPGKPFTGISYKRTIPSAIAEGYLCDARGKSVVLDGLDLGKVKTGADGDYSAEELTTELMGLRAPARIAEAWAGEQESVTRTMAFAPTVSFGNAMAAAFKEVGAEVREVYGDTPKEERRAAIEAFREGDAEVLVNVLVGAEGFDVPEVDCIVMARPTRSWTLYTQCVGRGLRIAPGKESCLVLDFCGASAVHDLASFPKLIGLSEEKYKSEGVRQIITERGPQELDINFDVARLAETVLFSKIQWTELGEEHVATFDRDHVAAIAPIDYEDGETGWGGFVVHLRSGREFQVCEEETATDCQEQLEDLIREEGDGSLAKRKAAWRSKPPTAAQAKWFRGDVPATRGEASDAITIELYRRARGL